MRGGRVEAVEDGVELDALETPGADASDFGGLVLQEGVNGAEGDDGGVLDADEPVVDALNLVGTFGDANHN